MPSMLTKRIIPCLDIKDGKVVKGINFEQLKNIGNPVDLATYYANEGADELVFLDITATNEKRKTFVSLVNEIARSINIPFTVGGGISNANDVYALLHAGADKVSINSAAIKTPELIGILTHNFGSQCIVIAIDTKRVLDDWIVFANAGKSNTQIMLPDWIKKTTDLGAGEILLTSIDHDGTKNGFANELIKQVSALTHLPIIASGGAGNEQHFADVFTAGNADAALAASVFHFGTLRIRDVKAGLREAGYPVR